MPTATSADDTMLVECGVVSDAAAAAGSAVLDAGAAVCTTDEGVSGNVGKE